MNFGNIPDHLLDLELYENWELEEVESVTLKMELMREFREEDLESVDLQLDSSGNIQKLNAWSKSYVGSLIYGTFGDMQMVTMKRNP
jgi:hypothetical protein